MKKILFSLFFLVLFYPNFVSAHSSSMIETQIHVHKQGFNVDLYLDAKSVEELTHISIDNNKKLYKHQNELISFLSNHFIFTDDNNHILYPTTKTLSLLKINNVDFVRFRSSYLFSLDLFHLEDSFYKGVPLQNGYINFVSVSYPDQRKLELMLTDSNRKLNIKSYQTNVSTVNPTNSFFTFFLLGTKHIATGYDHLLFLLSLLLIPLSFKNSVKIVTSFTVAHTITLVLSTMGIVFVPSRLVESLIALSICYVIIENLWIKNLNYRWLITFFLGLIHGLGFASALKNYMPKEHFLSSLIFFNFGIEVFQLILVLVLFFILKQWYKSKVYKISFHIVSFLIFNVGFYWFIVRII